jgi:stearoyl-CoA desaturase (delta-9 desaturase)
MEGLFINTMMNLVIPFLAIYSLMTLKGRRIAWWRTVLMWWLMAQVGISMGYHRLFTHRTYDTSPLLTWMLASFGMLAMQGTPMFWGAQHRIHHQNCDTPLDPHSPVQHGFWHAHGGFLNGYVQDTVDTMKDFKTICNEMYHDPDHGLLHHNEMKLAGAVWLGVPAMSYALFGAHATLWYLHVPQVLAWHSTMSVNSAMHTFGYSQPGEEADGCRARNVPWLWGLSMGEAWHANHHGEVAASFEGRWWEFDPVYRAIRVFESLGLVWNVRQRAQAPKDAEFPGAGCLAQMLLPPLLLVTSLVYMSNRSPKKPDALSGLFGDIELAETGTKSD